MTYKFKLFLVIHKKMAHKYKLFKLSLLLILYIELNILLGFFFFFGFICIRLLVFYTKLTHLA